MEGSVGGFLFPFLVSGELRVRIEVSACLGLDPAPYRRAKPRVVS